MLRKFLLLIAALAVIVVVGAVWYIARQAQTTAEVEQEWRTAHVEKITDLGSTRSLQILPLFEEARAQDALELEHGVSYLVRTDHRNILLDAGANPVRLSHNMQVLGVSAGDFDTLFITHAHPDHVGGLSPWWADAVAPGNPALDLTGKTAYVPKALSIAGIEPIVVTKPLKIDEGLATIGSIAFADLFPLALKTPRNTEQVLAVNVEGKGVVLIMGCGHPTVERIVARAQALFDTPIIGIVGGLHYEGMTQEQAQPHIAFVRDLKPQLVALSPHDSSPEAIQAFRAAFTDVYQEVQVGRTITIGK